MLICSPSKLISTIMFKELWNCPNSSDFIALFAENFEDEESASSFKTMSQVAREQKITVVGGSVSERSGDRLYNTCCVFSSNGELLAKHRKIHLFDINIEGDITFRESDTFAAGSDPTIVDTDVGRIGIGICHDIRFPELAMLYRDRGAHLICYPGAFNISTGEALWELEQQARQVFPCSLLSCFIFLFPCTYQSILGTFRAVDNQVYLIS
ncbi:hypothetical protein SASPL_141808 [Salvia splendens]|uniref:CN hydrolase domain-containing protein n=1 Tax=Salvia splendens TaxID=180675 RepID=A0A8X8Z978_SALSN|nr:hypothetical protein SASPL_141808 [Salvia splendens]